MAEVTNADVIKAYAEIPQKFIEGFGDEGDLTRKYLLNPAIFALLGDVRGKIILDEGCGMRARVSLSASGQKRRLHFSPLASLF
jgi:hypothetical protein